MTLNKFEAALDKLGIVTINIDHLIAEAEKLKEQSINAMDEPTANKLWVYQTILEIHKSFNQAFQLLNAKRYEAGWGKLERVEIEIGFLKRHLHMVKKNYKIKFIESIVINLQALFPFQLFGSNEMIYLETICDICHQKVTINNPCGHIPGELYMGKFCSRIITKSEFIDLAIVENPVNKYSVIFKENEDPQIRDNRQFGNVNYILCKIKNPYEGWKLEISATTFPHSSQPDSNPDDNCPCGENRPYKDCCLLEDGIHGFHYQFTLPGKAGARLQRDISNKKRKR